MNYELLFLIEVLRNCECEILQLTVFGFISSSFFICFVLFIPRKSLTNENSHWKKLKVILLRKKKKEKKINWTMSAAAGGGAGGGPDDVADEDDDKYKYYECK